jgi:putative endonuclease
VGSKGLGVNSSGYFVYIMASKSRRLYIGVTNNLERRVFEHKSKLVEGFTAKYNIDRLVYFAETGDVMAAMEREKQLKGWLRAKKIALIESENPSWLDLSYGWIEYLPAAKADPSRSFHSSAAKGSG